MLGYLNLRGLINLFGLVTFVAACAVMALWTRIRDAVLPPNETLVANDRRRPIFKDATIFTRYLASGLKAVLVSLLSMGIFAALGIAWDGWMREPPKPFLACIEDVVAGPAVRDAVFQEAQFHGAWCSTRDRFTALPCVCCFSDGFCWHSVDVKSFDGVPRMRVTDRGAPDGLTRTQELPVNVKACYYRTPHQLLADCHEETKPARIVALFRALELRAGKEPDGLVVNT